MSTCDASLDGVPIEVLAIIANSLCQKDNNSLCCTSKALRSALNPLLWRSLNIRTEDDWKSEVMGVGLLLRSYTHCPSQDYLQHVKNVIVTGPISQSQRYPCRSCLHGPRGRATNGLDPDAPYLVDRLYLSLVPLFQRLEDNQLRSFSWDMGTCPPCDVAPLFGPRGYLITKQSSIESLSFNTEGYCLWERDPKTPLGFQNFKRLHHLSWRGLQADWYMGDLRGVLECNVDHMKSLNLNVVDWEIANGPPGPWHSRHGISAWDDDVEDFAAEPTAVANFLVWKVLRLQPNTHRVIFPALTALSLSDISFRGAAAELASAFNGNMLRSLNLQNCRDCAEFLLALVSSGQRMTLRSLHLSINDTNTGKMPVNVFLESFEGLEELGLLIKPGLATSYYWSSAMHHMSTLKRFVYHERRYVNDGRVDRYTAQLNKYLDNQPFIERVDGTEKSSDASFGMLLARSGLECLAICDNLGSLKTRLRLMKPRSGTKLLHVRTSGADKYNNGNETYRHRAQKIPGLSALAKWAFGPNGLPNLKILAYGDFEHHGRYIEDCFLFGVKTRQPRENQVSGYYLLRGADRNDVMVQYGEFLGACPVEVVRDMEVP